MKAVVFRNAVELLEHVVVGGAAVVIGAPHRVRAEGECGEEAQREAAGAAEVGFGRHVDGALTGQFVEEILHGLFCAVIDHDDPLHWVCLVHHLLKGGAQQLHALVGDDHSGRRTGLGQGGSHAFHCATRDELYDASHGCKRY